MSTNEPTDAEFAALDLHAQKCSTTAMLGCRTCMRYADAAMARLRSTREPIVHGPFDHTPRCTTGACND